jgi:predicted metal-dependent phosphoesterase TrpH
LNLLRKLPFILAVLLLPFSSAFAQEASGAFGAASPGALGNAGGTLSDFQSVREDFVKKMRDGSYADVVRQGRENIEAYQHSAGAESPRQRVR